MSTNRLVEGLRSLPAGDRTLLKGFLVMALVTVGLGILYGTVTAFARAGFIPIEPTAGYRFMTLHGVTIFFYWLYFAQAALVLVLAAVYTEDVGRIRWRGLAVAGLVLMTAGFALSETMPLFGATWLYNAPPMLVREDLEAFGIARVVPGLFYSGYLLLALGLFLVAMAAIRTAVEPKISGRITSWSSISFAAVAWAGLLMVSGLAAINVFLPSATWAFGLTPMAKGYTMAWSLLFHNVHYLPLMATVLIWYVLVEVITGVKSIFGQRVSKIVFSSYLIFVPPTSLYHMFLEPNLAEPVLVAGSLLSLFISVPTVLVFLIIVASLETHARAEGGRGLFGWIRLLPWRNPAMAAMGMAVVNTALGGVFAFVLIQEKLAPLLSDTFFVPGYFHFFTVGTVTLTLFAALMYVIPGVTGRRLWAPSFLATLPYVITAGLLIFGAAGITAGYFGVPRRAFDVSAGGIAWTLPMSVVGIGAVFMAIGLAGYVVAFAMTLFAPGLRRSTDAALAAVSWGGTPVGRQAAWIGPLSVGVLVVSMYVITALSFQLIQSLPLAATGGH